MNKSNIEILDKAVRLWNAAQKSLAGEDFFIFTVQARRFYEFMLTNKLTDNAQVLDEMRSRTNPLENLQFFSRIPSVTGYIARGATFESDLMTRASNVRVYNDKFMDYARDQKFSLDPNIQAPTLPTDKKIVAGVFLYCAIEVVKEYLKGVDLTGKSHLVPELYNCKNCDDVVEFCKQNFSKIFDRKKMEEIEKIAHKAFIVEYADYSKVAKLVECKTFNDAVESEDKNHLLATKDQVGNDYIKRFKELPEAERVAAVSSIVNKNQANGFVQQLVAEVLRTNSPIPKEVLDSMKSSVDARHSKLQRSSSGSLVTLIKAHRSGAVQEKKALERVGSMIDMKTQEQAQTPPYKKTGSL